jgi:glyoxylase-like metal-dependent hydrolase (beta-lactamase superfamily II)
MLKELAPGISYLDLNFLGHERIIASAILHGPDGLAIVDPGPSSTLPVLRRGLEAAGMSLGDITSILLTHIHLDHAGAAGTLVKENPRARVYVHADGASHMAAPEKLIASATRLYGGAMDRLWGEINPVPQGSIAVLEGGEELVLGGQRLRVAYTPGHAKHHVSYFSTESGVAFVGDTAGVKPLAGGSVIPPTPPPDIDLESWSDSLTRIGAWNPQALFITHFGPHSDWRSHLGELRERLERVTDLARASLAREESDEMREAWFGDQLRHELRRQLGEEEIRAYEIAGRFDLNWRGLARYLRKAGT